MSGPSVAGGSTAVELAAVVKPVSATTRIGGSISKEMQSRAFASHIAKRDAGETLAALAFPDLGAGVAWRAYFGTRERDLRGPKYRGTSSTKPSNKGLWKLSLSNASEGNA